MFSPVSQHQSAHNPGNTGTIDRRCQQRLFPLHEDIAHGPAHDTAVLSQHQALAGLRIIPLGTRDHLVESIEMFDSGKCRILA